MEKKEKVFAKGFVFKKRENAPDFVVGSVSIKADEAIQFIADNQKNGWVNLNIAMGQSGKYYIELDTWQPKGWADTQASDAKIASKHIDNSNLPF